MKISKNRYLQGFGIVVLLLALVRVIFPGVAKPKVAAAGAADSTLVAAKDSAASDASSAEISDASADAEGNVAEDLKEDELSVMPDTAQSGKPSIFFDKDGKEVKHRIFSVPHFGNTFPDQQDVQILAATKHGVKPVQNRLEAENSKGKLVYVGSNPFFYVDKLNNSIPYLVPRASVLLQDIGRAYFDSLQIKGIPLHKIIVTSILRTKDDVAKLRTRNGNATENSCHLYGTTFDICYNRYKQIQTHALVADDELYAVQAASTEPLEETDPAGLVLLHALGGSQNLTKTVLIHGDCHQNGYIFVLSAPVAAQVDAVHVDVWIAPAL